MRGVMVQQKMWQKFGHFEGGGVEGEVERQVVHFVEGCGGYGGVQRAGPQSQGCQTVDAAGGVEVEPAGESYSFACRSEDEEEGERASRS